MRSCTNLDQVSWSNEDITVLGVKVSHNDLLHKNYGHMVDTVRKILKTWYHRGLTLLGKVQVINTLVASLFVYKMMVLPKIPKTILKSIDNEIRDYLWNGKKSKIALSVLQNSKSEGGLNLVCLEKKDMSLKATWPQVLYSEPLYEEMVYAIMGVEALGRNIWRCHMLPEDVKALGIQNSFWFDVLSSWSQYNFHHNFRIENQILWYNSEIRSAGKFLFWKRLLYKRISLLVSII